MRSSKNIKSMYEGRSSITYTFLKNGRLFHSKIENQPDKKLGIHII